MGDQRSWTGPEASAVDPYPANLDDATTWGVVSCLHDERARLCFVGEEKTVVAGELLEAYWEEESQGDDDEDFTLSR